MTSIAVYGAGAVGSLMAAKASLAGIDPLLIARGGTLAAIEQGGLTLQTPTGEALHCAPRVLSSDRTAENGPVDILIVTLKGPAWHGALPSLAPLVGADTVVVPVLNGVPFWYRVGQAPVGQDHLESIDPGGTVLSALPRDRTVGLVTYVAAAIPTPGTVRHTIGIEKYVGTPDNASDGAAARVAEVLGRTGFEVRVADDIRQAVWTKLWGNTVFNPLSVATGATMIELSEEPYRSLVEHLMEEARRIGEATGIPFPISTTERLEKAFSLGAFKTSMLQDWEKGRQLELQSILGAVLEMGRTAGVETPRMEMLYAVVHRKATLAGLLG